MKPRQPGSELPLIEAVPSRRRAGLLHRRSNHPGVRLLQPAPLPRYAPPMLCALTAEPFDDPNWVFEPKFDGQRILGRFDGKSVELLSRYGHNDALCFPEIPGALKESLARPALVDGEIVSLDEHGNSSFRMLQQRFHLTDPQEIARRAEEFPAYYYLFDLLYTDRYDVTSLPLIERKDLLHDAAHWSSRIRWTEFSPREGLMAFAPVPRISGRSTRPLTIRAGFRALMWSARTAKVSITF